MYKCAYTSMYSFYTCVRTHAHVVVHTHADTDAHDGEKNKCISYVGLHMSKCVCMSTCSYAHARTCARLFSHLRVHADARACVHVHTSLQMCACACVLICTIISTMIHLHFLMKYRVVSGHIAPVQQFKPLVCAVLFNNRLALFKHAGGLGEKDVAHAIPAAHSASDSLAATME